MFRQSTTISRTLVLFATVGLAAFTSLTACIEDEDFLDDAELLDDDELDVDAEATPVTELADELGVNGSGCAQQMAAQGQVFIHESEHYGIRYEYNELGGVVAMPGWEFFDLANDDRIVVAPDGLCEVMVDEGGQHWVKCDDEDDGTTGAGEGGGESGTTEGGTTEGGDGDGDGDDDEGLGSIGCPDCQNCTEGKDIMGGVKCNGDCNEQGPYAACAEVDKGAMTLDGWNPYNP